MKNTTVKNVIYGRFFSLLITLYFSTAFCKAQTGYVNFGFVGYIKGNSQGYGASFGIGGNIDKQFTIGPAFDFIKFKGFNNPYVPAYLNLRFYLPIEKARIFINASPGYGLYKEQTIGVVKSGGFYFNAGAGVHGTGKTSPYIQIGLRSLQFTNEVNRKKEKASTTYFGFDIGIRF
jgi:hypothetical protein